jgi:hypothetical protein
MGVRFIVQNTAALFETMYLQINFEDLELGEIVKQPPLLMISKVGEFSRNQIWKLGKLI